MAFGVLLGALYRHQKDEAAKKNADQARQDALKQQAFQNAYEWNQQQDEEARERNTVKNQGVVNRDYELANGIDPTSGKLQTAASLPSSVTKGPQNSSSAPLKDQYSHALAAWKFYASQPPTKQNIDAANNWKAIAAQLDGQLKTQETNTARTNDENIRFNNQVKLKGIPTYGELHPRARTGGKQPETADADTVLKVEQQIRNSPDPQTTAAHLRAQVIMLGGNPKTVEAIDALGRYYAGKKHQVGPTKPKTDNNPL